MSLESIFPGLIPYPNIEAKYTDPDFMRKTCVFRALESAFHVRSPQDAVAIRITQWLDLRRQLQGPTLDPTSEVERYIRAAQRDEHHVKNLIHHIELSKTPMGERMRTFQRTWDHLTISGVQEAIERGDAVLAMMLNGHANGEMGTHMSRVTVDHGHLLGMSDGWARLYPQETVMTALRLAPNH